MHLYADEILKEAKITYLDINETTKEGKEYWKPLKSDYYTLCRLKMCNNFCGPGRRISIKRPLRRTLVLFN